MRVAAMRLLLAVAATLALLVLAGHASPKP